MNTGELIAWEAGAAAAFLALGMLLVVAWNWWRNRH